MTTSSSPQTPVERQRHVLLVDDMAHIRALLGRFLNQSGMAVTFAGDGVDGLAAARARVPDAIVCDLDMPNMSGLALCRALRDDPITKGVPIVMVSGVPAAQTRAALDAGCDAVLVKPCTSELLVSTLERLLARPVAHRGR